MRSRFAAFQPRDILLVAVPLLALVAGAAWIALWFGDPAPPQPFVLSSASAGSPYHRYAERYKSVFKHHGVKLEVRESTGSVANLGALADPSSGVQAAFVQGGLASAKVRPDLLSVGRVTYEPLWVFQRDGLNAERLADLKGKRILVGPAGGGTNLLALRLLAANGVNAETATLINSELPAYVDLLAKGEADAGFLVLAAEAQTIQRLLRSPTVRPLSFDQAEAYIQRFPFLSKLVLRKGVVDFAANIPASDITLVATTAAVLVRRDAHQALVNLLTQAVVEVHGQPALEDSGEARLFQRVGEFPISSDPEFSISEDAKRVYRSGAPFLQRYVPFWVATMVDRLFVSLVVLIPLLIPLGRLAPKLYNWRMRRRIVRWYVQLKALEAGDRTQLSRQELAARIDELDRIEATVDNIEVPLGFANQLYDLRQHIEVVRRRLTAGPANAPAD
ncbi:MAG: TAXI family TRAP transporter solute-binding subunit [Hyphomicrobiaceae bacterium]